MLRASAQDSGYLPDLPGFPSGAYADVGAVGVKIHGPLSAKEMDPVTGDLWRFIRMTYYGPTSTYDRMGICSVYTDPKTVARYSNPSAKDGRDVLVERRSVKYYRRDGSGGGYSLWYYKAGAVDKLFEYEFQSEDIGMPSPGAVGRPFENLSYSHRLEIQFVPKATIFTLKNEESRRPDDVMGAMLLRLEGAAGAASGEVQGIIELGSLALDPMKAVGLAQNMGQAIVHWDQTMAAIQRQVDDTANTYWESRLGLINPEDAYRKEGAFLFHVASSVTGGWVVKGMGRFKLAGKFDNVVELKIKPGSIFDKPPGWSERWNWHSSTRGDDGLGNWRWRDPQGGEWRRHIADKHHPESHWDYNPNNQWNSPWYNIDNSGNFLLFSSP
jgi:hypothetical protein